MSKVDKWSPLRIPGKFRQYASQTEGSDDPLDSWDASDWDDPDKQGIIGRITPNHAGQWLIVAAVVLFGVGVLLWLGKFFQLTHRNPWTLVAFLWPASLLVKHVHGREVGFNKASDIDWTFIINGRSLTVIPGVFVERFGKGDIKHYKITPIKSRAYGAYRFKTLKLGDLDAKRENLISKAKESNRGPESDARIELPGTLTGENTETILGNVYGVHGGSVDYHDSGSEVDMRVTNPNTLNDDIANDVLTQLQLYDQRIIPELKSEIETVESQKQRYKQRAESERDPELDRIFGAMDKMSDLINRNSRSTSTDSDDDVDDINQRAKESVGGDS